MPFVNHLPKLPVMFIHGVCNLLCWTKKRMLPCFRIKITIFTFQFSLRVRVTIPLSVVTAVCVTRPLFLYVCCCMGDAMLLFVPSCLTQPTACKGIRTAHTCTYIKPFHTTHKVE